ncbi:MAG: ABC transporter ATP-binding protein, partial [Chloroflexota bacterium]
LSIIIIELLISIFSYFNKFYLSSAGLYIVADIRERVFAHLQRLSLTFHESTQSGDIIYRMTADVKETKGLMVSAPQELISRGLTIVSITVVMMLFNWQLGLVAFSVIPFMYLFTRYFGETVEKTAKKLKKKEGKIASIIAENAEAMSLVKAYGLEASEKARFDEQNQASMGYEMRVVALTKTFKRVMEMMAALGTSFVLYVGARTVLNLELQPGTLVLMMTYVKELYGPIDKLSEAVLDLAKTQVAGQRLLELVENDMIIEDSPTAVPAPEFKGKIQFNDVTFAYKRDKNVLENLNIDVEAGETVALIGHSGAGKSTLISLLLRFYDPQQGEILIDGQNIQDFTQLSLRSRMTILLQGAFLFRKSIRDNIAFGRPEASDDEIVAAAKAAQAHDFIVDLPEGYDTLIVEGGKNLSGGQMQRISIARAMIRNTPILILDEPTTGLDAASEAKVNTAVRHLTQGKTTFIIAHQFSTVRHADKIALLEQGQSAQIGTHQQLLQTSAEYRELVSLQANGRSAPPEFSAEQMVVAPQGA